MLYSNIYDIYLVLQSIKHKINSGNLFEIITSGLKEFSIILYLAGNSNKTNKKTNCVSSAGDCQQYKTELSKITLEFLGSGKANAGEIKCAQISQLKLPYREEYVMGVSSLILLLQKQTLNCEGRSLNRLSMIADAKEFNLTMGKVFCI